MGEGGDALQKKTKSFLDDDGAKEEQMVLFMYSCSRASWALFSIGVLPLSSSVGFILKH